MITIRPEIESDYAAIMQITELAFRGKPYAGGDEHEMIGVLRDRGALFASLVAIDGTNLIGQITFSPASITSGVGVWYALGPVSVIPKRQGEGIGAALIEAGINVLTEAGAWGCILTGNPDYYSRHGFKMAELHCPDNEPEEYFMLRLIGKHQPDGKFAFHEAFYAGS